MENLNRQPEFDLFEEKGNTMTANSQGDHSLERKFVEYGLPIITSPIGKREKVSLGAKYFTSLVMDGKLPQETYDAWYQSIPVHEASEPDEEEINFDAIKSQKKEERETPTSPPPAPEVITHLDTQYGDDERPGFNALPRGDRW